MLKLTAGSAKANSTFGRLNDTVWKHSGISSATKLKVYLAVVLTTLLYGQGLTDKFGASRSLSKKLWGGGGGQKG
jgi:hypothetical protein